MFGVFAVSGRWVGAFYAWWQKMVLNIDVAGQYYLGYGYTWVFCDQTQYALPTHILVRVCMWTKDVWWRVWRARKSPPPPPPPPWCCQGRKLGGYRSHVCRTISQCWAGAREVRNRYYLERAKRKWLVFVVYRCCLTEEEDEIVGCFVKYHSAILLLHCNWGKYTVGINSV